MSQKLLLTAAFAVSLSLAALTAAQAAPGAPIAASQATSDVILVAGGCGPGAFRDRFGRCRVWGPGRGRAGGAPGRRGPACRGCTRRLRARISLAPAVPALRRPLIAAFDRRTVPARRSILIAADARQPALAAPAIAAAPLFDRTRRRRRPQRGTMPFDRIAGTVPGDQTLAAPKYWLRETRHNLWRSFGYIRFPRLE